MGPRSLIHKMIVEARVGELTGRGIIVTCSNVDVFVKQKHTLGLL